MALSAQAPKPPGGYSNKVPGASASARILHTGTSGVVNTADGNNSTPVITEVYLAEMFVPFPTVIQGLAFFAGSVNSDNIKLALFDAFGNIVCATASTAGNTTADAYQRVPIASEFQTSAGVATAGTQAYLAPGTYFLGAILDGTTSRLNTFAVGNFGAGKVTGAVYATAFATTSLSLAVPTTFTTALGPIGGPY